MLSEMKISDLLEKTASDEPVPGGGSIAALSAALAASLTEMVANLTLGKKGYEEKEAEARPGSLNKINTGSMKKSVLKRYVWLVIMLKLESIPGSRLLKWPMIRD